MRIVAEFLENDEKVIRYETNIKIDTSLIMNAIGMRPAYLHEEWTSYFCIYYENGNIAVLDVLEEAQREKIPYFVL